MSAVTDTRCSDCGGILSTEAYRLANWRWTPGLFCSCPFDEAHTPPRRPRLYPPPDRRPAYALRRREWPDERWDREQQAQWRLTAVGAEVYASILARGSKPALGFWQNPEWVRP